MLDGVPNMSLLCLFDLGLGIEGGATIDELLYISTMCSCSVDQ